MTAKDRERLYRYAKGIGSAQRYESPDPIYRDGLGNRALQGKACEGCGKTLPVGDPDICARCDEHGTTS